MVNTKQILESIQALNQFFALYIRPIFMKQFQSLACVIIGLFSFVIETVTFVFGDPMLEMSVLIPYCWDTRYAKPTPNPLKKKVSNHLFIGIHHILTVLPKSVGIAGTKKASDNLAGNPRIKRIKIFLSFSQPRLASSAGKMNDF